MFKSFIDIQPPVEIPSKREENSTNLQAGRDSMSSGLSYEKILEKKDATLLFMTMVVSLTSKHEMPIVQAYSGSIPTDIRGIYRIVTQPHIQIAPHFYFEDAKILRYWNRPFETEKILSRFAVSIGIDFSMTAEMSKIQKMYASFRNKLWAAWLQARGQKVIPNISFPDEWQEEYWLEGWPKNSIIAVSSVGIKTHGAVDEWLKAVDLIHKELRPIHILRYGPKISGEDERLCTYFANDNNRAAYGR